MHRVYCLLHAVNCMLYWRLNMLCSLYFAASCMLTIVQCMLCCMLYVTGSMLYIVCFMLNIFSLYNGCCVFYPSYLSLLGNLLNLKGQIIVGSIISNCALCSVQSALYVERIVYIVYFITYIVRCFLYVFLCPVGYVLHVIHCPFNKFYSYIVSWLMFMYIVNLMFHIVCCMW